MKSSLKRIIIDHEEYDHKMQQALEKQGLDNEYEIKIEECRKKPDFCGMRRDGGDLQARAIHRYFRSILLTKENKRLREKAADSTNRLFEEALAETLHWYNKEPTEENRLKIDEAKARFGKQRQDDHERESRDLSPLQYGSISWLSPMPIWSKKDPYGYCQATGKNRTAIRRFLDSIDAKVVGKEEKAGRGRPPQFYNVSTNLRVLDHWLKEWVEQTPDKVGGIAVLTFDGMIGRRERLAGEGCKLNASSTQTKQFVRIIQKHLRRVRKGLSVSFISEAADGILKCSDLP